MTDKEDFDKSIKLSKTFLLLSGIRLTEIKWNRSIVTFIDRYLFYFNLFWLYTDVWGEINWLCEGLLKGTSFIDLSITVPCITISLLGTSKALFLINNRETLLKTVDKLRDIHPVDNDDFDENSNHFRSFDVWNSDVTKNEDVVRKIVRESVKFVNFIGTLMYYICSVVICAFPLMPVTSMAYDYYTTGQTEWKYPFLVNYFFDVNNVYMWPPVYVHHVISTCIVGANVIGPDSLFYALCIYIQMHFRLLCHRLENVVGAGTQIRRELISAVQRHQELIAIVDQMEIMYSKSTLFNILTSSLLICLSGFIITVLTDFSVVIAFGCFLIMSLTQIYLLCFFGDSLMRSSTQISSAVYNSLWYETDQRSKKIMLLILMRAQKPCKLTACKFADLNLTAFTTILSRSWSYFALLRTMYN